MKLLVALALIGLVGGKAVESPSEYPVVRDYHNEIGIPLAKRIKAAEEAMDFDGARITGGTPATLGQYPYLGGLLIDLTTGGISVCGSTLLTSTRSITAAHCWSQWTSPSPMQGVSLTVVLGSVLLFTGGTRVTTSDVVMHPEYDGFVINDIAIIKFPAISFSGIGIWTTQYLSHVSMPVISNAECVAVYGSDIARESVLCTDTTGRRSICTSDSGGPLVVDNVLIGVTSFQHGWGCQAEYPAGFARVTYFASWILTQL